MLIQPFLARALMRLTTRSQPIFSSLPLFLSRVAAQRAGIKVAWTAINWTLPNFEVLDHAI